MSDMESDGECSGSEEENANDELYDGGGSQDSNVELDDAVALQEWREEPLARPERQGPALEVEQHVVQDHEPARVGNRDWYVKFTYGLFLLHVLFI